VVDDEHDVAAVSAVGAVWATERIELLPAYRGSAVTAVAGSGVQHDAVDERGHSFSLLATRRAGQESPGPPSRMTSV
jgi:hypothetical protein